MIHILIYSQTAQNQICLVKVVRNDFEQFKFKVSYGTMSNQNVLMDCNFTIHFLSTLNPCFVDSLVTNFLFKMTLSKFQSNPSIIHKYRFSNTTKQRTQKHLPRTFISFFPHIGESIWKVFVLSQKILLGVLIVIVHAIQFD